MQITIEDLESLKELNDELEENHIETEKALQEDLGNNYPVLYAVILAYALHLRRREGCRNPRSPSQDRGLGGGVPGSGKYYNTVQRAGATIAIVSCYAFV